MIALKAVLTAILGFSVRGDTARNHDQIAALMAASSLVRQNAV